jgi:aspartate/methionine/tyrosine aminotransferase
LGVKAPEATFYIYFEVGDELEFTKKLFKEYNTKVLPATFLGRNGIGSGYVRIALVYDYETTREALKRVANCYKSIKDSEKN